MEGKYCLHVAYRTNKRSIRLLHDKLVGRWKNWSLMQSKLNDTWPIVINHMCGCDFASANEIHLNSIKRHHMFHFFNHILSFSLILSYSSFFLLLYYDDFILKRPHNHYNGICAVDRSNGCCKWSTSEELDITLTLEALQFMCIIWNFENSFEVVLSTL
jgi:hypothetical protein